MQIPLFLSCFYWWYNSHTFLFCILMFRLFFFTAERYGLIILNQPLEPQMKLLKAVWPKGKELKWKMARPSDKGLRCMVGMSLYFFGHAEGRHRYYFSSVIVGIVYVCVCVCVCVCAGGQGRGGSGGNFWFSSVLRQSAEKWGTAICRILVTKGNNCYNFLFAMLDVVVLLFYVHGKHVRSCLDGQLT